MLINQRLAVNQAAVAVKVKQVEDPGLSEHLACGVTIVKSRRDYISVERGSRLVENPTSVEDPPIFLAGEGRGILLAD